MKRNYIVPIFMRLYLHQKGDFRDNLQCVRKSAIGWLLCANATKSHSSCVGRENPLGNITIQFVFLGEVKLPLNHIERLGVHRFRNVNEKDLGMSLF